MVHRLTRPVFIGHARDHPLAAGSHKHSRRSHGQILPKIDLKGTVRVTLNIAFTELRLTAQSSI